MEPRLALAKGTGGAGVGSLIRESIAGIVVGVFVAVFLVFLLLRYLYRNMRYKQIRKSKTIEKGNSLQNSMGSADRVRNSHQELSLVQKVEQKSVKIYREANGKPIEKNWVQNSGTGFFSDSPNLLFGRKMSGIKAGMRFSYDELHEFTEGFREKIGSGAFGLVYKGALKDQTAIAVKKLEDKRGLKDLEAEVITLGSINHVNLVALLGFCVEHNHAFLVYEFVSRGSLDRWIFQKSKVDKSFVMPWKNRFEIVRGTARALAYLHEELQIGQAIIHLDIKPDNILLNDSFVPKVADFGMAKLLGAEKTFSLKLAGGGTAGYMAPEIIHSTVANCKMDVYSFGSVLLEVLSGRRLLDMSQPEDGIYLPAWAIRKVTTKGKIFDVIDPLLKNLFDAVEGKRLISIALLCLQRDPDERPGMSTVLRMIEGSKLPPDLPHTLQNELEINERLVRNKTSIPESRSIDLSSSDRPFVSYSCEHDNELDNTLSSGNVPLNVTSFQADAESESIYRTAERPNEEAGSEASPKGHLWSSAESKHGDVASSGIALVSLSYGNEDENPNRLSSGTLPLQVKSI